MQRYAEPKPALYDIAGAFSCRSRKSRIASTSTSASYNCSLSPGGHAALTPLLVSSSTTRTFGAPSGLSLCFIENSGDKRTLLRSATASKAGEAILPRATCLNCARTPRLMTVLLPALTRNRDREAVGSFVVASARSHRRVGRGTVVQPRGIRDPLHRPREAWLAA